MNVDDIMTVLQCCAPKNLSNRRCTECPMRSRSNCHTEFYEIMMNHIINEQSIRTRIANDIERLHSFVVS